MRIDKTKFTPELIERIELALPHFQRPKQLWKTDEMATVFAVVNMYDGTNVSDPNCNCGGVRTNMVNKCRLIIDTYKDEIKPKL